MSMNLSARADGGGTIATLANLGVTVPAATLPTDAVQASSIGSIANISATVASNALTINLAACSLVFKNATLNGSPIYTSTGALSLVVPSTATLGSVSAQSTRYAVLVAYNSGTPVLCVTNLGGGLNLDETGTISPTTIAPGVTSPSTIYSASTCAASSPYRLVGYFDATEATAGTWATAPSNVQGIGGQSCVALSGFGVGQSWQTVTRNDATTYYNTTGRPIILNYVTINDTTSIASTLTVNGVQVGYYTNHTGQVIRTTTSVIIPVNASYIINVGAGNTISITTELR